MFPNLQSLSDHDEYKDNPAPSGRRRSSVIPPSLQFLVDHDSQQARDEPPEWEKSWDQTTDNAELCDFLDRVHSKDSADPSQQSGESIRRGS
ncbi:hypothetical protein AbraIFM66950_009397 [Aspergillus brasiliensis]|nr:hypothetical protein AbraIFM66950_009397 [Aspergillus brasiliensis]